MNRGVLVYTSVAAICVWSSAFAKTHDFPRYNVDAFCSKLADMAGPIGNAKYNECIDAEQEAYDQLKSEWQSFPESFAENCLNQEVLESYALLLGCKQLLLANQQPRKQFRY